MTNRTRLAVAAIGALAIAGAALTIPAALASDAPAPAPVEAAAAETADATVTLTDGTAPGLTLSLDAPTNAVAGTAVTITTAWIDENGRLLGSMEDWGDLGAGSVSPPTCEPGAVEAGGDAGGDALTHTWDAPGTYAVTLAVTTGGCGIEEETASVTFDVVVS